MDKLELFSKCLNLVEGRENPESWWGWWNEHESEVEKLLNHGEFLKLKPRSHGFSWVPVFGSQKGAITILEKNGIAFEISNLYQERYLEELDAYCKEQKRVQREKQKKFKAQHPEWFTQYPKFSKMLAKVLDSSDEIKSAATVEKIVEIEKKLGFILPTQVREFFLITEGVNVSTGLSISLSQLFNLTIHTWYSAKILLCLAHGHSTRQFLRRGEVGVNLRQPLSKIRLVHNNAPRELLEKELVNYLREN